MHKDIYIIYTTPDPTLQPMRSKIPHRLLPIWRVGSCARWGNGRICVTKGNSET